MRKGLIVKENMKIAEAMYKGIEYVPPTTLETKLDVRDNFWISEVLKIEKESSVIKILAERLDSELEIKVEYKKEITSLRKRIAELKVVAEIQLNPKEFQVLTYDEDVFIQTSIDTNNLTEELNELNRCRTRDRIEIQNLKSNMKSLLPLIEIIPDIKKGFWEWTEFISKWKNRRILYKLKENIILWI